MIHNDVLRSLRFMLKSDDKSLAAVVALGGGEVTRPQMTAFLEPEDAPGFVQCDDVTMGQFLDGLILKLRGPQENAPVRVPDTVVTNNTVFKKLRVAFNLREDDLVQMMKASGFELAKPELSALTRSPGHRNFRPAGDQFLRNFLKALTQRVRPSAAG